MNKDTRLRKPYKCPTHKAKLVRRPEGGQTYEQKWCGTWYDCPRCHYSVLERSVALQALYDDAAVRAYDEGRRARLSGQRLRDNPWKGLAFSAPHWERGWNAAKGGARAHAR